MGYYSITKEVTTLLLLIACALWTLKNAHNAQRIRIAPAIQLNNLARQDPQNLYPLKDRHLIRMLLMDIILYAVFSFLMAIFLMYQQITQHEVKSLEQIQIDVLIRNVCLLSIAVPFCSSCYTNLIASATFRREVKKIFLLRL